MKAQRDTGSASSRGSIKAFSALATLGACAHNGFERWAGIGIFLEPWIGRRNSNILWSGAPVLLLAQAFGRRRRDERTLAFASGVAVAGASVHFVDWPWIRRFGFLPWLTEAEGLEPDKLGAYNTILWLWLTGGLSSIALETRPEHRKWAAAGIATAPALLMSARHHFVWARARARSGDPRFTEALLAETEGSHTC